jgi:AraC family transcriptional regulator
MAAITPLRFERGGGKFLAGIRRQHAFADVSAGTLHQWREFESLGSLPDQVGTRSYGVMCGHSPIGLEYMCAAEVSSFANVPPTLARIRLLPQAYAAFLHTGPLSTLGQTWQRIIVEWLGHEGYESAHKPDFEIYERGVDHDTSVGPVEIWISIVAAGTSP